MYVYAYACMYVFTYVNLSHFGSRKKVRCAFYLNDTVPELCGVSCRFILCRFVSVKFSADHFFLQDQ